MEIISREAAAQLGQKFFLLQTPCKYGHFSKRYVCDSRCCECASKVRRRDKAKIRLRSLSWKNRNRERYRASGRRWVIANPEKVILKARRSYQKHAASRRAEARERYKRMASQIKEKAIIYYQENTVSCLQRNIEWRKKNPDAVKAIKLNRRARQKSALGNVSKAEIAKLKQRQIKCVYCHSMKQLTIDHIIALANGGSNEISNLQILCRTCNLRKKTKDPIDFAQANGLLL